MKYKTKYLFNTIFLLVGILISSLAVYLLIDTKVFLDKSVKSNGKIIEFVKSSDKGKSRYSPVIEYIVDEQVYSFKANYSESSPSEQVGDRIDIYYEKENPQSARAGGWSNTWMPVLICGILGLLFFTIGGGLMLKSILRARLIKSLEFNSRRIQTNLVDIKISNYAENKVHPYYLVTKFEEGGKEYTFESDYIWYDPTQILQAEQRKSIEVWVDPNDFKKYYVNLDFLPESV